MTLGPNIFTLDIRSFGLHIPRTCQDRVPELVLAPASSLTWSKLFFCSQDLPYPWGRVTPCLQGRHLLQPVVLKRANLNESMWPLLLANPVTEQKENPTPKFHLPLLQLIQASCRTILTVCQSSKGFRKKPEQVVSCVPPAFRFRMVGVSILIWIQYGFQAIRFEGIEQKKIDC